MKYECHVTTEYVDNESERFQSLERIAKLFSFRVAKLYKRNNELSTLDTFMTGYAVNYAELAYRMKALVDHLGTHVFSVARYKIEEILLYYRNGD